MDASDATPGAAGGTRGRSEAAGVPLAAPGGPMANRGVNLPSWGLGKGGFDTLEVTLRGGVTSLYEREIRPLLAAAQARAKDRKPSELETLTFGPMQCQVHGTRGRRTGMLSVDFKLAIGQASWLHLASNPLKPGRWGFGRVELTDSYHGGGVTDAIATLTRSLAEMGLEVSAASVTRADLSVNLAGGHVPALAERLYGGVRGYLAKSKHKRIVGDPPETIYLGDVKTGPYGFCIYHKVTQLVTLHREKKITTEELSQRLARFDVLGSPSEVTRFELRLRGSHLAKYVGCKDATTIGQHAAELYREHAVKALQFTAGVMEKGHRSRAALHPVWKELLEAIDGVPWDLRHETKSTHRIAKAASAMTMEKYRDRGLADLIRAGGFVHGTYESSLDMAAAIREMCTPEAIDRLEWRRLVYDALHRFGTDEQLEAMGYPTQFPEVDENGNVPGGLRVNRRERLPASVRRQARKALEDLQSDLPF